MTAALDWLAPVMGPLASLFELGGPVVMLLVGLSLIALALILAKLWQHLRLGVGRHSALIEALELWDRGARRQAIQRAGAAPSHLALLTVQAMQAAPETADEDPALRARLTGIAEARMADLNSGLRLLDTVGQTAPLLGLLGTVVGMIDAFQSLQAAGSTVDPAGLAGGIWVALLTTAVGLAVAIPATLVLAIFDGRIARETQMAGRIIDTVLCAGLGNGVEPAPAPAGARQPSHA